MPSSGSTIQTRSAVSRSLSSFPSSERTASPGRCSARSRISRSCAARSPASLSSRPVRPCSRTCSRRSPAVVASHAASTWSSVAAASGGVPGTKVSVTRSPYSGAVPAGPGAAGSGFPARASSPAPSSRSAASRIAAKSRSARSATSSSGGGPVGVGQGPEHRHDASEARLAAHGRVEAALAELGLAVRAEVECRPRRAPARPGSPRRRGVRRQQLVVLDEVEVVGRGVVLGVLAVRGAREPADRQVEAERVVLPLVVAVGRVVADLAARAGSRRGAAARSIGPVRRAGCACRPAAPDRPGR